MAESTEILLLGGEAAAAVFDFKLAKEAPVMREEDEEEEEEC